MASSLKVYIRPQKSVVSSIAVGGRAQVTLGQVLNVDASDPDDGETLVYDSSVGKYVVKPILVDSNNVINLIGGTF
jgi:hypothetical protein